MLFSSVSWPEGKPEEALYYCSHCGESWNELERIHSIQKGKWRATKPFKGHAGFKVSKLASPFKPMSVLAHKYEEAKGDPNMMKTFVNTQLAETYKETGEVPKWEGLYRRREKYPIGKVPAPGVVLLMGVDIQKDRIEFEVVAVCRNRRTYSIDYRVLDGDTARDEVWDKLESCIWETYQHESGKYLPIHKVAIDTGYRTTRVYQFCRKFSPNMVYPVKGSDNLMTPVGTQKSVDVNQHGKNLRRGLKLWHVGTSVLKNELYSMLQKEEPLDVESFPPGYCHFPEYDEEYFKMLTAEELRKEKDKNGRERLYWCKIRERNEVLDCRVYVLFLTYVMSLHKYKDHHWDNLESKMGISSNFRRMESIEPQKKKIKIKRKSSDWI